MLFSPISTYVVCMQNIAIIFLCKSKNNSSNPIKKNIHQKLKTACLL